jgi:hypothetical protein
LYGESEHVVGRDWSGIRLSDRHRGLAQQLAEDDQRVTGVAVRTRQPEIAVRRVALERPDASRDAVREPARSLERRIEEEAERAVVWVDPALVEQTFLEEPVMISQLVGGDGRVVCEPGVSARVSSLELPDHSIDHEVDQGGIGEPRLLDRARVLSGEKVFAAHQRRRGSNCRHEEYRPHAAPSAV